MHLARAPPSRVTVERWIANLPELKFDGIELRCRLCDTILSWTVKTRVLQHVASDMHKARLCGDLNARERQKQFNLDLVKVMVGCNIPWDKLNNLEFVQLLQNCVDGKYQNEAVPPKTTIRHPEFKQFLQNCVNGKYKNVTVPPESTVRQHYVAPVYEKIRAEIISELDGKYVWVCVEETTDAKGQNVANVLVGGMDESIPLRGHLISSKILDSANAETISTYVDSSLRALWGKNYDKSRVLLYLTDMAAYMKESVLYLRNTYLYGNLIHLTCLAHGLYLIAELMKSCYPNVNQLINSVKKVFVKAPSRKKMFLELVPGIPLPPEPLVRHSGTWLDAASYYYDNFDGIKCFINQLDANNSHSISIAQQAFLDPMLYEALSCIHNHFSYVSLAIHDLECGPTSAGYSLTNAMNIVSDLRQLLVKVSGPTAELIKDKLGTILTENPGYNTFCRIVDLLTGKEVNFSEPNVNVPTLKHYTYFKYAPVILVDIERSFSCYKWILSDKDRLHRLKPEHLEQLMVIAFNLQHK